MLTIVLAVLSAILGTYALQSREDRARGSLDDGGSRLRVRRVRLLGDFRALKDAWNGILERSGSRGIFLSWEWLYYWWLHFNGGRELYILVVEEKKDGRIVGIAPFCFEAAKIAGTFTVRRIKFLGSEYVGSDFLDFIVEQGFERSVVRALYRYLVGHENEWDVVEISDIDRDALSVRLLRKINRRYGMLYTAKALCPYIKLPGSFGEYEKTLTQATRRELRKKTRSFEGQGDTGFAVVEEQQDVLARLDEVFRLHNDGFRLKKYGRQGPSDFSAERALRFHRDVIPEFLRKRWLKLYLLSYRERPIACSYAFRYKNNLFAYQTGLDSEWKKWSPGTVLTGYCIRKSIEDGVSELHYLRGTESYKARWAKVAVSTVRLTLVNRTVRGQAYGLYAGGKSNLRRIAGSLRSSGTPLSRNLMKYVARMRGA